MLPNYFKIVKEIGSKSTKTRAREGGASVFTYFIFMLFVLVLPVRRKILGAKPKQAGKKGGCGGNSAMPERNQTVDSPAVLLESAGHHRKTFFSFLEEKIDRVQNPKCKESFSVVVRAERATTGLASLVGVLLKECSNFVQETPKKIKF